MAVTLAAAVAAAAGCSEDVLVGTNARPLAGQAGGGAAGAAGDAAPAGAGGATVDGSAGGAAGASGGADSGASGAAACVPTACGTRIFDCGNCVDDDLDGRVDSGDDACLGPCDDTEDSFFGGIPGENSAPCRQDCYFDGDTGAGNDGCFWDQRCDTLSIPPDFGPSGTPACSYDPMVGFPAGAGTCASLTVAQPPLCGATCLPVVPNGCDCFGCCELPARSGHYVWLGYESGTKEHCDPGALGDASRCRPCTPVPSCLNPCAECETCAGEPSPPLGCEGASSRCPSDRVPCGASGEAPCGPTQYCVTGCCADLPF
ncbi:MAG: hypothetical protein IT376_09945 [Polyangiaceae bacterium]|nr:hypothetical protein [Polyangiaceae bacterium]